MGMQDFMNPRYVELVTPSDTVDLPTIGCIRADADGAVSFIPAENDDDEVVTMNLVAGEILPIVVRRVKDTGTDSINIHVMANKQN